MNLQLPLTTILGFGTEINRSGIGSKLLETNEMNNGLLFVSALQFRPLLVVCVVARE